MLFFYLFSEEVVSLMMLGTHLPQNTFIRFTVE